MCQSRKRWLTWIGRAFAAIGLALAVSGCITSSEQTPASADPLTTAGLAGGFASDDPTAPAKQPSFSVDGGAAPSTGALSAVATDTSMDAERAIAEADIVQVLNDRLYALSGVGGMTVIDVSVPEHLKLLGRIAIKAEPFEMYVRNGVVYAMYSSFPREELNTTTGYYTDMTSSRLLALDVSDPTNIRPIGAFDMPGVLSDSRMVGDVLYVVSHEDGYCWGCTASRARTSIMSINVASPAAIAKVDQLSFDDLASAYGSYSRSISVTTSRIYVSGIVYDDAWGTGTGHSTIQIVDISDPLGKLVAGAQFAVAGVIESRWQMDELSGVLRVISQSGSTWSNGPDPTVETFTVESSQRLVPLGKTTITLPKRENLRSVRFDGARAYAVTFQRTDPLFTIDLTDPAHPVQAGSLEMPGYLYYMEPRGDRLIALGMDSGNATGGMTVSILDVADLAKPALLSRANFGGQWNYGVADQDRIHKAFKIFDDVSLIAMPFSGTMHEPSTGCGTYKSGVQLFDFTRDTVTLRGVVPMHGVPRRSFLHRDRLFAVSDDQATSFDITSRDAPVKLDSVTLANSANRAIRVGQDVVALGIDPWSGIPQLTVLPVGAQSQAPAIASFDFTGEMRAVPGSCYAWEAFTAELFANGNLVYLVYNGGISGTAGRGSVGFAVLDLTDPAKPVLAGAKLLPISQSKSALDGPGGYGLGVGSWASRGDLYPGGGRVVRAGNSIALQELAPATTAVNAPAGVQLSSSIVHVVDLSDPSNIRLASSTPISEGVVSSGLFVDGASVLSSHFEDVSGAPGKVRFYVDRLDVSNVAAPAVSKVNVPGSLFGVDAGGARIVTIDYARTQTPLDSGSSWDACQATGGMESAWVQYKTSAGAYDWSAPVACVHVRRSLKLVELGATTATLLDTYEPVAPVAAYMGADRLWLYQVQYDGAHYNSTLETLTGIRAGHFSSASTLTVHTNSIVTQPGGTKVAFPPAYQIPGLMIYDTADPAAPKALVQTTDVATYSDAYPFDVVMDDEYALIAMGPYGVSAIPLQ